jgi:hypothetical protein
LNQEVKIFITFFFFFSFFIRWTSWNEESRFALIRAIVDEKRFEIDSFYNQTGDRSYFNDHYYSDKFPGVSFLTIPTYALWKNIYNALFLNPIPKSISLVYYTDSKVPLTYTVNPGFFLNTSMALVTIFTASLFSALTIVILYKFSKYFVKKESSRMLIVLGFALGGLTLPYALVFLDHALEGFFLFTAFYLLFKMKAKKNFSTKNFFIAGLLTGFAFVVRATAALLVPLFLMYILFIRRREFPIFILGLIIGLLPFIVYNYSIVRDSYEFINFFQDTFIWPEQLSETKPAFLFTIPFFHIAFRNVQDYMNLYPRILISPESGLFVYYPLSVLSMFGIFYMYKKYKIEAFLILSLFLILTIIVSSWNFGFSFGPRHLSTLIPFLVIPLFFVVQKNKKIFYLFLIPTIFIGLLSLQFWEGTKWGEIFKISLNPFLQHYLSLFLRNGPRSILFENLILKKEIDIRLTPHSCGLTSPVIQKTEIPIFSSSLGIIALGIPFLCLVPLAIVIFLIWGKQISQKFEFTTQKWFLFLFILVLIFLFASIRIRTFLYEDNWYAPEFQDGKINEDERWISQNASLLLFNKENTIKKVNLSFNIETFNRTRNLLIYLNDELIDSYGISSEKEIVQKMNLKSGRNELKFYSMEGCDRPTQLKLADCDLRCLSFKIGNIQIVY